MKEKKKNCWNIQYKPQLSTNSILLIYITFLSKEFDIWERRNCEYIALRPKTNYLKTQVAVTY